MPHFQVQLSIHQNSNLLIRISQQLSKAMFLVRPRQIAEFHISVHLFDIFTANLERIILLQKYSHVAGLMLLWITLGHHTLIRY